MRGFFFTKFSSLPHSNKDINFMMQPVGSSSLISNPFKSMKYIHYYYFIGMLCLIFLLAFKDFNTIFIDSFSGGDYLSKDTGIWALVIFLFFRSLDTQKILSNSTNIYDLLYALTVLAVLFLVKTNYSPFIPAILLISIWFYSSKQNDFPILIISWFYLLLSLPYEYYLFLTPQLQLLVVLIIEGLLNIFGIPVFVNDNYIAIPTGQFVVEGGCSGLKFLSVNVVLLYLYSILSKFNFRQFFLALIVVVFISLITNWLRIFIIVIVAHNWGFEVPYLVKDHSGFGWVVYSLFLIPMFYLFLMIDKAKQRSFDFICVGKKEMIKIPSIFMLLPILIFSAF